MSVSTRSDFVDFIKPLHDRLRLYDRTKPSTDQAQNDAADPTKAIPLGFMDAMTVREEVFVREQKIPLENELDEDDDRSFHWVAYASIPTKHISPDIQSQNGTGQNHPVRRISNSTKIPIGTIRLVPPPHPPHPTPGTHHQADALDGDNRRDSTAVHDGREAYIKLGRLSVIPEFRKAGISKLLIDTALAFARSNPEQLKALYDPAKAEALRQTYGHAGSRMEWRGLVLVHAQVGVQKLWRKHGFETDETMGTWDEEGIDHVGMWKRLDVEAARRKSKHYLGSPPLASP